MRNVFGLIFVWVILSYAVPSHADLTYTVKKGDTLCEISRQFDISVSKIKQVNGMKSNRLLTGQTLVIPGCRSAAGEPEAETNKLVTREPHADSEQRQVYHVVKKGDTEAKVARRYSLSEDELRGMNNLETDKIRIGTRLLVGSDRPKYYSEQHTTEAPETRATEKVLAAQHAASSKTEEVRPLSTSEDISELGVKERLILFAKKMLHLPYRFGGTGIFGLDCSAYVQKVFAAVGVSLPRSAREQFTVGEQIDREELSAGDLVFFRTYAPFPSHVGIYLGNDLFIHASSKSKEVTIDSLETPYYLNRFIGGRRLVQEDVELTTLGQ